MVLIHDVPKAFLEECNSTVAFKILTEDHFFEIKYKYVIHTRWVIFLKRIKGSKKKKYYKSIKSQSQICDKNDFKIKTESKVQINLKSRTDGKVKKGNIV